MIELLQAAGLAASNGEARRLCAAAGRASTTPRVEDETMLVDAASLRDGAIKLSAGKKRHVLVRPA